MQGLSSMGSKGRAVPIKAQVGRIGGVLTSLITLTATRLTIPQQKRWFNVATGFLRIRAL